MLLALSDVTYVLIGWFKFWLLKFLYEYRPCRFVCPAREEDQLKDRENQRKHEREMMDKQIKMADNLRYALSPCLLR